MKLNILMTVIASLGEGLLVGEWKAIGLVLAYCCMTCLYRAGPTRDCLLHGWPGSLGTLYDLLEFFSTYCTLFVAYGDTM